MRILTLSILTALCSTSGCSALPSSGAIQYSAPTSYSRGEAALQIFHLVGGKEVEILDFVPSRQYSAEWHVRTYDLNGNLTTTKVSSSNCPSVGEFLSSIAGQTLPRFYVQQGRGAQITPQMPAADAKVYILRGFGVRDAHSWELSVAVSTGPLVDEIEGVVEAVSECQRFS
jgi:hypothetical protein